MDPRRRALAGQQVAFAFELVVGGDHAAAGYPELFGEGAGGRDDVVRRKRPAGDSVADTRGDLCRDRGGVVAGDMQQHQLVQRN